jgi:ribonucleoside-diphosphate reductase alpha chain
VLRARYLQRDAEGNVTETSGEMLWRVATYVARVERQYGECAGATADAFYDVKANLQFLPNSPTLMNAGTTVGQLAACFVLPIGDSLDGIFRTLPMRPIHQSGGGVGYDFSALRPAGDRVSSTGGVSSGSVSRTPSSSATGSLSLIAGCSSGIERLTKFLLNNRSLKPITRESQKAPYEFFRTGA